MVDLVVECATADGEPFHLLLVGRMDRGKDLAHHAGHHVDCLGSRFKWNRTG